MRRRWPIAAYALLVAIGIPWYYPAGDTTLHAGVPLWVWISAGASLAISILTAVLLRRPWTDGTDD